ncbi:MAG TPA: hypothetical protein VL995_14335 [Cellvibrio sp.]|nr:hypothetical protein [Cellvibrio sp.]
MKRPLLFRFCVRLFSLLVSLWAIQVNAYGGGSTGGGSGGEPGNYASGGGQATTTEAGGTSCTVYRPTSLNGSNAVILWGNGTGASPSSYGALLRHWASWGFVVVAANTQNAGTGTEMRACLDWLSRSSLASRVNLNKVGTSGHSQGGGGAIMAGVDSRITATAPIEGYTLGLGHNSSSHTRQSGPMLLLSGGADTLVSPRANHAPLFSRANVPVFWATLAGASHFEPTNNGGGFRGMTTAWFLYQLNGDATAANQFTGANCGYCNASAWAVQRKGF